MWKNELLKTDEMREREKRRTAWRIRAIQCIAIAFLLGIAFGIIRARADTFPYSEDVPLAPAVQEYIWDKCEWSDKQFEYYCFTLGAIELESSFNRKAVGHNKNGTVDRGLCQINSSRVDEMCKLGLIGSSQDLFDEYKNIDCAFELMDRYIEEFGVTESAYYAYNTGKVKEGSNKNSRAVMRNTQKWKEVLE